MITLDKIVEGLAQVQLGQAVLCERLDAAIKKLDCLQAQELVAQFKRGKPCRKSKKQKR